MGLKSAHPVDQHANKSFSEAQVLWFPGRQISWVSDGVID